MSIFGPDKRVSERKLDEILRSAVRRREISESGAKKIREKVLGDGSKDVTERDLRKIMRDAKEHWVTQGFKPEHLARFEERAGLVKPEESPKKK